MSNYQRTMELTGYATNSAGASQKQFEKTMESLESKLNRLHNAWEQFTTGITNAGIIKGAVDLLTNLLTTVNKITDALDPLNTGWAKTLTAILAFKAGSKLVNSAFKNIGTQIAAGLGKDNIGKAAGEKTATSFIKGFKDFFSRTKTSIFGDGSYNILKDADVGAKEAAAAAATKEYQKAQEDLKAAKIEYLNSVKNLYDKVHTDYPGVNDSDVGIYADIDNITDNINEAFDKTAAKLMRIVNPSYNRPVKKSYDDTDDGEFSEEFKEHCKLLFDAAPDAEAMAFLAPFKTKVDSLMSPVVGRVACDMLSDRPESKLSNLLADILIWAGKDFDEKPVISVYNMGGIRASLSKGDVTIGNVIDVAPFENKLCFMTLKGSQVTTLFEQIAARGGEGVNHVVRAVISKDKKLVSLKINGEDVNPDADYRIATIDYLADGNDGLPVLKSGTNRKMLTDKSNNLRFIIMDFFRENTKQGREVNAEVEGRITVE